MITKLNPEALPDNSITNAKLDTELVNKVNDKQDKLTAGTGITISSDNNISCTLDTTVFTVVDSLPTTPEVANINKIHLIKESTVEGNIFSEYLWVEGKWEKLGDFRPSVDLAGYAKETYVNNQINQKCVRHNINESIYGEKTFGSKLIAAEGIQFNDTTSGGPKIIDKNSTELQLQTYDGAPGIKLTGLSTYIGSSSGVDMDAAISKGALTTTNWTITSPWTIYAAWTFNASILSPMEPYSDNCVTNKKYVDNLIQQMQTTIDALTQRVTELETSLNEISYVEEETTTSETTE